MLNFEWVLKRWIYWQQMKWHGFFLRRFKLRQLPHIPAIRSPSDCTPDSRPKIKCDPCRAKQIPGYKCTAVSKEVCALEAAMKHESRGSTTWPTSFLLAFLLEPCSLWHCLKNTSLLRIYRWLHINKKNFSRMKIKNSKKKHKQWRQCSKMMSNLQPFTRKFHCHTLLGISFNTARILLHVSIPGSFTCENFTNMSDWLVREFMYYEQKWMENISRVMAQRLLPIPKDQVRPKLKLIGSWGMSASFRLCQLCDSGTLHHRAHCTFSCTTCSAITS